MIIKLAYQQFFSQLRRRDGRALLVSLFLMTSLISLLSVTGARLQHSMSARSAELLGADSVLSSSRPLAPFWQQAAQDAGLKNTQVTQFTSMVEANQTVLLTSIRAVTSPYPFRGHITLAHSSTPLLPEPGTVWVEPAVLSRLQIALGDMIQIGYTRFKVAHLITASPDRGTGFSTFNPQIIMRSDALAATGVIVPGSRATYRLLLAGEPKKLAAFKTQHAHQRKTWQRWYDAAGAQPVVGNTLGSAARYLRLSSLFALLLGAFAIYLSLRRFAADQQQRTALLLSLGLPRTALLPLFGWQLVLMWMITALPGTLVGLGLHQIMMTQLAGLLPTPLPNIDFIMLVSSALLAAAILLLAGLTTLMPLGKTSILHLFHRTGAQTLSHNQRLFWLLPLGLFSLIGCFVDSWILAAELSVALIITGWLAGWCVQQSIHHLCLYLARHLTLIPLLRLRIRQQRQWHRVQGGVLVLLLTLMTTLFFARQDLLQQWQSQLPTDTPNQFVINIQPWQKSAVTDWLAEQKIASHLYPMIRARIISINGVPKTHGFTAEQLKHNTLNRELNLTFAATTPAHNTLVAGHWSQTPESISVEQSMAQQLGLSLGDTLGFQAGNETFTGRISSIRHVEWTSFRPNFYVIFSPGVIDQLPATYITSFRVDGAQHQLTHELLTHFPTLTVIDIDQWLQQAQTVIAKLSDSAAIIMLLTLLSGVVLIITIVQQDLAKRRFEVALLRTLGATERQIRQLDWLEYTLIGGISGLVTCSISEALLALLYQQLLEIEPQWHPWLWLSIPTISVFLLTISGRLVRQSQPLSRCYNQLKNAD